MYIYTPRCRPPQYLHRLPRPRRIHLFSPVSNLVNERRFKMVATEARTADPILTRYVEADKVPWYKKPNLRMLYINLVPVCLGVEWTSGFDSSMMNGIQTVQTWKESFDYPDKAKLGFMSASYSLGCILALPFVPIVGDTYGRKKSILTGSFIMVIGAVIQAAAQNCKLIIPKT